MGLALEFTALAAAVVFGIIQMPVRSRGFLAPPGTKTAAPIHQVRLLVNGRRCLLFRCHVCKFQEKHEQRANASDLTALPQGNVPDVAWYATKPTTRCWAKMDTDGATLAAERQATLTTHPLQLRPRRLYRVHSKVGDSQIGKLGAQVSFPAPNHASASPSGNEEQAERTVLTDPRTRGLSRLRGGPDRTPTPNQ